jgi:hypothetical protein
VIPRPEMDCSIPLLIPREGCREERTLVGKEEVELEPAERIEGYRRVGVCTIGVTGSSSRYGE